MLTRTPVAALLLGALLLLTGCGGTATPEPADPVTETVTVEAPNDDATSALQAARRAFAHADRMRQIDQQYVDLIDDAYLAGVTSTTADDTALIERMDALLAKFAQQAEGYTADYEVFADGFVACVPGFTLTGGTP